MKELESLLTEIRACQICVDSLPLGPNPVVRAHSKSKINIIGQAPGTRVHASGIPWDDASGKRLRSWLGVDSKTFYNEQHFAIVPMGFCYPGKGKSGDLPPRPECAAHWHERLLQQLPNIKLTLLIGNYAQKAYLPIGAPSKLTDRVLRFEDYLPSFVVLPHPSPRNIAWFKRNPWFEESVIPKLQVIVKEILFRPLRVQ